MDIKWRIGIDVGGTFTDAVLINNDSYELVAKMKIPTTHKEGVAVGIIRILRQLIEENRVAPENVLFIAHGTTQATNALLEGDVASVGIIGMGTGIDAIKAKKDINLGEILLSPGKYLKTKFAFIDEKSLTEENIKNSILELTNAGSEVIVASAAYSVEDPCKELKVISVAQENGIYATGGHEISELYGLKVRTRTAAINGSLIPKMIETANMTETAIIDSGISTRLMIMRCDGGVMSIDEVRKRPILTMLSGLAAGVAGALMYEKVSDGLFFEVGGTSIDICVIKDGKVMIKNAQVGGHKTYLTSLDVRTLGIAGGSMICIEGDKIIDVGPRSTHIAGLDYECFTTPEEIDSPKLNFVRPKEDDAKNHAIVTCKNGKRFSLTLAGAANILGVIPKNDYAEGYRESAICAWQPLAAHLGMTVEQAAKAAMDIATDKVMKIVDDLMTEYEMDKGFTDLVGGGGSASVIIPYMAQREGFKWRIAKNAPYISTIGVALAMVKEQIERTAINPTEADVLKIRQDIFESIVRSGAVAETVDVTVEIDHQKNILRATATGSTELRSKDLTQVLVTHEQMIATAASALDVTPENVHLSHQMTRFSAFEATTTTKGFFGLLKKKENSCCIIDREGIVRLKKRRANITVFPKAQSKTIFVKVIDDYTEYSEANAILPGVHIFYGERMLDLSSMGTLTALLTMFDFETKSLQPSDEIMAIIYK